MVYFLREPLPFIVGEAELPIPKFESEFFLAKIQQKNLIIVIFPQVDEELLKKSIGDSDSDLGIGSSASSTMSGGASRKTWTTTRRSFFKRKKGGRSSSRDSSAAKELASFSDMASLNYSDSGALHEVEPQINSYVRVERLDCKYI